MGIHFKYTTSSASGPSATHTFLPVYLPKLPISRKWKIYTHSRAKSQWSNSRLIVTSIFCTWFIIVMLSLFCKLSIVVILPWVSIHTKNPPFREAQEGTSCQILFLGKWCFSQKEKKKGNDVQAWDAIFDRTSKFFFLNESTWIFPFSLPLLLKNARGWESNRLIPLPNLEFFR